MKKILQSLAVSMVIAIASCKKFDHYFPVPDNCRVLSAASISSGVKNNDWQYTYDNNGYLSSSTFTMYNGSDIDFATSYFYKRLKDGTLLSMTTQYKDNTGSYPEEPIKITKDALGRIIKLEEYVGGELNVVHGLKYNPKGLVIEHSMDIVVAPEWSSKYTFKYNSINQVTEITMRWADGRLSYHKVIENVGKYTSNEAYLVREKGWLPIDMIYGEVIAPVDGGVGTVLKSYTDDGNGGMVLSGTSTTKALTFNSKGYPQTITYEYDNGYIFDMSYSFDCGKGRK